MTTFERLYVADKATHTEIKDPYYTWYNEESACRRILAEFGLPGRATSSTGTCRCRRKTARAPSRAAAG